MVLNGAEIIGRLSRRVPGLALRSDHEVSGLKPPEMVYRPAAVLVPIVERPDGLTILLTRRTDHLHDHAGQVSFPGGRIEPDDPDPETAALREAEEEVGLCRNKVRLAGRLDTWRTGTGYEIVPVVGLVDPDHRLTLDPFEVAASFEVPLSFILDPANHRLESRFWKGMDRKFYVLPYLEWYIWGATAGMLVNLARTLTLEVKAE
jgi:8-oxo-dGTP pyrophosphatase MutT (NUDIX family)